MNENGRTAVKGGQIMYYVTYLRSDGKLLKKFLILLAVRITAKKEDRSVVKNLTHNVNF